MMTKARPLLATLLALVLLLGASPSTRAAAPPSEGPAQAIGRTPPRLSYTNGEVSFFRPGAQDWASAQANTPLAPGDELYTSTQGDLELQVGTRAFVRGATRSLGSRTRNPISCNSRSRTGMSLSICGASIRVAPWSWTRPTLPSRSITLGTTAQTSRRSGRPSSPEGRGRPP